MTATLFGWCSANQHDSCPFRAPGGDGGLMCSCACHESEDKP